MIFYNLTILETVKPLSSRSTNTNISINYSFLHPLPSDPFENNSGTDKYFLGYDIPVIAPRLRLACVTAGCFCSSKHPLVGRSSGPFGLTGVVYFY